MQFQLFTLLTSFLRPHAYLDPGSGSFIVQLLIAAVAGAAILVKVYWNKVKGLFKRSDEKKEKDDNDVQQ